MNIFFLYSGILCPSGLLLTLPCWMKRGSIWQQIRNAKVIGLKGINLLLIFIPVIFYIYCLTLLIRKG